MSAASSSSAQLLQAPGAESADLEQRNRRRKLIALLVLLAGLLVLLLLFGWYLIFRQPINPIPVIPVSQVPKYSNSLYGVTQPIGIVVSQSGDRIYLTQGASTSEGTVMDGSGKVLGKISPPGLGTQDHQPVYTAIDPLTSEVYMSDRFAGAIYIFDKDGRYLRPFKLENPIEGWQPIGMTFDASGNLYVTDLSAPFHKVMVIDPAGKVLRVLGKDDNLNFPNGVAVEKSGEILVSDSNNGRIVGYGADDQAVVRVGRGAGQGYLGVPRGITIDSQGRIFTVDTTGQHVAVYREPAAGASKLDFLGTFGDEGAGDGKFSFPTSVALDARGRVYITDTFNDRVQVWSY